MKVIKKTKSPIFSSDLLWSVTFEYEGVTYTMSVGDEDMDCLETVIINRMRAYDLHKRKRACNLYIRRV